jgi:hypothetical protein
MKSKLYARNQNLSLETTASDGFLSLFYKFKKEFVDCLNLKRALTILVFAFLFFGSQSTLAQGSETFANLCSSTCTPASGSYGSRSWTGDNGVTWSATDSRSDQTINTKAITIRNGALTFGLSSTQLSSGIGSLTLNAKAPFGSPDVGNLQLVVNGVVISSKSTTGSSTSSVVSYTWTGINVSTITSIVINQTTTGSRITIDNISWTGYNSVAPSISSTLTANATYGQAFSYSIVASGSPTSYAASSLPNGLSVNSTTGVITGSPTQVGDFNVSISATNSVGTDTKTLVLSVAKANQTISFNALTSRSFGDESFILNGTASSGLSLIYSSSNTNVATISGNTLTIVGAGTTTITASQAGNEDYNAATNVLRDLVVNKANQTITFNTLPDRNDTDGSFTLGATTSSGLPITYVSSNENVVSISGNTATIVAPGTTTITASQAGNDNYNAAVSVNRDQTIINTTLANQTITFNALSALTYGDAPFTLNATVNSSLPITFTSSDETIASIAGNIVTILRPGTVTITASQDGNETHNPAQDVPQTLVINKKELTITNVVVADKDYDGTTAATITSANLTDIIGSDSVTLVNAAVFASANAGEAIEVIPNFSLTGTEANRYIISQPTGLTATIFKVNQNITFESITPKTYGDAAFTLTATGGNSGLPVTFVSSNANIVSIVGNSATIVGVGEVTITASQSGNTNYNAATDATQTITVSKANQTITFNTLVTRTTADATFNLFATGGNSGIPVVFTSSNLAVATISGNTVTIEGPGSTTIIASQEGNEFYNAATSVSQNQLVLSAIAKWTFEGVTVATNTGSSPSISSGATTADQGFQTTGSLFSAWHSNNGATWTTPVGNGSAKSLTSNSWSVNDYYEFKVNTSNHINLAVAFDQTGSNTGPSTFKLQYSTDGINYTDFGTNYSVTNDAWSNAIYKSISNKAFDLSSIATINNKPAVYFRIVNVNTTAISGTFGSGGANRIDNFTVTGVACNTTAQITNNTNTTVLTCDVNSISLTATGGATYSWSNGTSVVGTSADLNVTEAGTYTVTVTSANGCSSTSSIIITANKVTSSSETIVACNSYIWSAGNGQTYTTSGTYTHVTTNEFGCTNTATLNLTINAATSSDEYQTACSSYTWDLTGVTYTESGDYDYVTTNENGCTHTITLHLTISNGAITSQPTSPTICKLSGATASISVAASGANSPTYQWQALATTLNAPWVNVSNNANYSGATSATLNITRTTTSLPATGTKYRVVVTSCGTSVTSDVVTLAELATLSTPKAITIVSKLAPTATTCEGSTVDLLLGASSIGNVQWQMSTTSATEGFSNVGTAYTQTALSAVNPTLPFTTPVLTQDTWFRAVFTNGVCSSTTSAAIKITVSTTPTAGTIAGGDVTVCAPLVGPSTTVFDTTGTPLANTITNSTTLTLEGNSSTSIVWEKSTNFVNTTNATPVWSAVTNATATTAIGASYSGVGTSELVVGNLAATTWFRARVINGACSVATPVVKITVSPTAKAGTVTSPTTVCTGGSITFTSAAYTGSAIAWEVSTTSTTTGFVPVAGANGLTFTMDNVTLVVPGQKFYVRSVVTSGDCTQARSAVKTITVNPLSVAGTATGGGTVCSGGAGLLKVAGNVGTIQWEYSTDNQNFANVPFNSATLGYVNPNGVTSFNTTSTSGIAATYNVANITEPVYFRAKITSGSCSSVYTNTVQYVIGDQAVAGTATAASSTICAASGTTITLTGNVGAIQWQKSTNWTAATPTWTAVSNATASTLATGNLTASTAFRAVVTIGSCSTVETTPVIVTVNLAAKGGTVAIATTNPGATICAGSNKTLTVTGNVGTIQWQMSTVSATEGFENVVGATSTPYTFTNITQNTWFRVVATNGVCTTTANSTAVGITVTNIPAVAGIISGNNSVCTATGSTLTLEGSTGTIVWQKSINWTATTPTWSAISGQTSATLATGNLTASTAFRAVLTSGSCVATTSPYVVTVSPLAKATAVTGNSLIKTLSNAICTTTTAPLTLSTGYVGTIQWQYYYAGSSATAVSNTSAVTWTDIDGATSSVYNASSATAGNVWFRVKMTSGPCSVVYSTPVNVWFKTCSSPQTREDDSVVAKSIFAVKGYPNPYSSNFVLSLDTPSESMVYVNVYDMTGKLIENREVAPSALEGLQLGSEWASGVYNVIVAQDNQMKTIRMVKKE